MHGLVQTGSAVDTSSATVLVLRMVHTTTYTRYLPVPVMAHYPTERAERRSSHPRPDVACGLSAQTRLGQCVMGIGDLDG